YSNDETSAPHTSTLTIAGSASAAAGASGPIASESVATTPRWPGGRGRTFGHVVTGASRAEVEALEDAGADTLWVTGHIASPSPGSEAVTALAHLAAMTARAWIGTAVLLLPLYPPAIVAKQFAELDRLTGGRVLLGIGVGGEFPAEFSA